MHARLNLETRTSRSGQDITRGHAAWHRTTKTTATFASQPTVRTCRRLNLVYRLPAAGPLPDDRDPPWQAGEYRQFAVMHMESPCNEGQETPSLAQIADWWSGVADDDLLDYGRHPLSPLDRSRGRNAGAPAAGGCAKGGGDCPSMVDVGASVSAWRCDPSKAGSLRTGQGLRVSPADHKWINVC
jgi:hypothetical protein